MEVSSSFQGFSSCKKQKGPQIEPVDRLTDLPDSLLVHILSFLPIKDAVRTVLLRRFGNLWTLVHSLDFDRCLYHKCEDHNYDEGHMYDKTLMTVIRHVLMLHERANVHRFRLRFEFNLCYLDEFYDDVPDVENFRGKELRIANEIDTWIRLAVRKNVKVLELDFKACGFFEPETYHRLHNCVLSCDSLLELKLLYCRVELKAQVAHMGFLRTLSLDSVLLSDDTLNDILSGCSVLENISLIKCYGLKSLNFTSLHLKNVMIELGPSERAKLEISCPHVVSLNISGWIERVDLNNVPSLINATIDFSRNFICAPLEYRKVRMLLEKLNKTKALIMENRCILVLTIWDLKNLYYPSSEWKQLFLRTQLTKWHLPGIASLLKSSLNLEMLDIRFQNGSSPFCFRDDSWLKQQELDEENFWDLQQHSFHCLTRHLKTIRLSGYIIEPRAIKLVQFLLRSAVVLEKLVINTQQYVQNDQQDHVMSGKLHEYSEQLLTFPRASYHATIVFL